MSAAPAAGVPDAGTSVNAVAGPKMSMLAPGLPGAVSLIVATLNPAAAYVAATGFVTPPIVSVPALEAASPQEAPASVIVTVVPLVAPVAVQLV